MRLSGIARAGALLLCLGTAKQGVAQNRQPLVLQHGFLSNAATWDRLAPWLEKELWVTTHRYTTGWNAPYQVQADRLRNSIDHLPDTTILIGHSNGGVIARRVANMRRTKGFVTVGTPHTGAPLAESLMDGGVEMFGGYLEYAGSQAYGIYSRPEFDHFDDSMRQAGLWAAAAESWLGTVIRYVAFGMSLLDDVGSTVLTDMQPGSGFFAHTNSQEALDAETARVEGPRVAFNTSVTWGFYPDYMIWKGLVPAHSADFSMATDALIFTLLLTYDHYTWYDVPWDMFNYEKQQYAHVWLWAAAALSSIDSFWCVLIGANTGGLSCEPADGIVPVSRQHHPAAKVTNRALYGPAHQEQINSDVFRNALKEELEQRFIVKPPATSVRATSN